MKCRACAVSRSAAGSLSATGPVTLALASARCQAASAERAAVVPAAWLRVPAAPAPVDCASVLVVCLAEALAREPVPRPASVPVPVPVPVRAQAPRGQLRPAVPAYLSAEVWADAGSLRALLAARVGSLPPLPGLGSRRPPGERPDVLPSVAPAASAARSCAQSVPRRPPLPPQQLPSRPAGPAPPQLRPPPRPPLPWQGQSGVAVVQTGGWVWALGPSPHCHPSERRPGRAQTAHLSAPGRPPPPPPQPSFEAATASRAVPAARVPPSASPSTRADCRGSWSGRAPAR
jgi:hypothetical protein